MPRKGAIVFGPNGGQNLDYGGGSLVSIHIANALRKRGFEVTVAAVNGLPNEELWRIHGTTLLPGVKSLFLSDLHHGQVRFPPRLGLRMLARAVDSLLGRKEVGMLVFGDDAPKAITRSPLAEGLTKVAYVHFSYFARSRYPRVAYLAYNQTPTLLPSMLYWAGSFESPDRLDKVLVNSKVTKGFTDALAGVPSTVVHAPGGKGSVASEKDFSVVHAAQQGKAFLSETLIAASKELRSRSAAPSIYLLRAQNAGSRQRRALARGGIVLLPHLAKADYDRLFARAMFVANFRLFEPFGMATVDGMSLGAVPIVYRSDLNGSWTDILESGRHGLGFSSAEEFASAIENLHSNPALRTEMSAAARERSLDFTLERFEEEFFRAVQEYQ